MSPTGPTPPVPPLAAPTPAPPGPPPGPGGPDETAVLRALVEGLDAAIARRPPGERPGGAMLLRVAAAPEPAAPPADDTPPPDDTTDLGRGVPTAGDTTELDRAVPTVGDATEPGESAPAVGDTTEPGESVPAAAEATELGVYPLDDDHPLEALLGFVAPPGWAALGVASPGLGHPTAGGRPPQRVHVTMLLARSGASATVMRRDDRVTRLDEPPGGVVADACRRALGLPTEPAPPGTAELWVLSWLDRLVEAAARRPPAGDPPTWGDAAALHPAIAGPGDPPPSARPAALADAIGALATRWGWAELRAEPHLVAVPGPRPTPDQAAWMDDGMFARWLLAWFPPVDDLLDACHDLLPGPVAAQVTEAVDLALHAAGARR